MIGTAAAPGMQGSAILGLGSYRPTRVVANGELCARIDSSDEWIRRRSGIETRRYAGPDESILDMAVQAAKKALADAGVPPGNVDLILLACMSNMKQSPAAAPEVAWRLGIHGGAVDLGAACAGFCYALALADGLVRAGSVGHVLVVGVEKMTDMCDTDDRSTAFLFADGAGAALVGPSRTIGIAPAVLGSDGGRAHLIGHDASWLDYRDTPGLPWPTVRMAGQDVFRWVSVEMPAVARMALAAAGVGTDALGAFVPHQANLRMVEALAKALRLPPHVAVARDVVTAGNTSSASIPLAMQRLLELGEAHSGDLALLIGFGAGLVYAAQVVILP